MSDDYDTETGGTEEATAADPAVEDTNIDDLLNDDQYEPQGFADADYEQAIETIKEIRQRSQEHAQEMAEDIDTSVELFDALDKAGYMGGTKLYIKDKMGKLDDETTRTEQLEKRKEMLNLGLKALKQNLEELDQVAEEYEQYVDQESSKKINLLDVRADLEDDLDELEAAYGQVQETYEEEYAETSAADLTTEEEKQKAQLEQKERDLERKVRNKRDEIAKVQRRIQRIHHLEDASDMLLDFVYETKDSNQQAYEEFDDAIGQLNQVLSVGEAISKTNEEMVEMADTYDQTQDDLQKALKDMSEETRLIEDVVNGVTTQKLVEDETKDFVQEQLDQKREAKREANKEVLEEGN